MQKWVCDPNKFVISEYDLIYSKRYPCEWRWFSDKFISMGWYPTNYYELIEIANNKYCKELKLRGN